MLDGSLFVAAASLFQAAIMIEPSLARWMYMFAALFPGVYTATATSSPRMATLGQALVGVKTMRAKTGGRAGWFRALFRHGAAAWWCWFSVALTTRASEDGVVFGAAVGAGCLLFWTDGFSSTGGAG